MSSASSSSPSGFPPKTRLNVSVTVLRPGVSGERTRIAYTVLLRGYSAASSILALFLATSSTIAAVVAVLQRIAL